MKRERLPLSITCPTENTCTTTAGAEALPCGDISAHTPSLLFAERSCVQALLGARARLEGVLEREDYQEPRKAAVALTGLAWSELELGMATADETFAAGHFAKSTEIAESVLFGNQYPLHPRIDAGILRIHMPAFKARRAGSTLDKDGMQTIREGLGDLHMLAAALYTPELSKGEIELYSHVRVKIALLQTALRIGTLLYPASVRESHGTTFQIPGGKESERQVKHDVYQVNDAGEKLPVRINTRYKPPSGKGEVAVRFGEHCESTLRGMRQSQIPEERVLSLGFDDSYDRERFVREVPDWLAAEVRGEPLTLPQQGFLRRLSYKLNARLAHAGKPFPPRVPRQYAAADRILTSPDAQDQT